MYIYIYIYIWIYRCLHTLIPLYIRILFYIPSYTHKMIRESRSIPHFSWFFSHESLWWSSLNPLDFPWFLMETTHDHFLCSAHENCCLWNFHQVWSARSSRLLRKPPPVWPSWTLTKERARWETPRYAEEERGEWGGVMSQMRVLWCLKII